MIKNPKTKNRAEEPVSLEALDPALKQALGEFKASVRAWSDAAAARPRTISAGMRQTAWRTAAGWSLTALLLAGTMWGGVYQYHQREVAAQRAAAHAAEQQRQAEAQRVLQEAQAEEEMLASVDTAVSREVPTAMEPLAQLSEESESR
ncbi:MAG TPA: hypothetical protein VHW46_07355 [Terracidiphilus sp.]|jgi:hypothetical protein|nr:hypothetical protein [Terracidiphilus sp.]